MNSTKMRTRGLAAMATTVAGVLVVAGCASSGSREAAGLDTEKINVGAVGTVDQFGDISKMCGDKPVKVGVIDGVGTNSWGKTMRAEVEAEAAKCANIESIDYKASRGDIQAQNSALISMASQGVDVIVISSSAGGSLEAMKKATKAGSVVVPIAVDPMGKAAGDYLDYVDWIPESLGKAWATWMVEQLGDGGGTVVVLGGPAGNVVTDAAMDGINEVIDANPQVKLLTTTPATTNWDPAQAQQTMSGLLSKYPEIDGIITDYGATASGAIRAYEAANVTLPPIATTDENDLSCGFADLQKANPDYKLATVSSRSWIGRVGLRKGMAAFQGTTDSEPSRFELGLFEDSTGATEGSKTPQDACIDGAPADATPSSLLTVDEMKRAFG